MKFEEVFMVDPVVHAKMTMLIQHEKKLKAELEELRKDIPTWAKRVELAQAKGMGDLTRQAGDRLQALQARVAEIEHEFDVIQMDRDMLRYQARRPTGIEAERAEALLDSVRLAGLVDPDANDENTKNVTFDFTDEE